MRKRLETIDAEMAQRLYDRLYYLVRCNLVPKKGHDNFLKDKQAGELTEQLVVTLDGLFIHEGFDGPLHSSSHYMSQRSDDLEDRIQRSIGRRPHQLPVMNMKPAMPEDDDV